MIMGDRSGSTITSRELHISHSKLTVNVYNVLLLISWQIRGGKHPRRSWPTVSLKGGQREMCHGIRQSAWNTVKI